LDPIFDLKIFELGAKKNIFHKKMPIFNFFFTKKMIHIKLITNVLQEKINLISCFLSNICN